MTLTVGDLLQIAALFVSAGGIIWKVSQVASALQASIAVLSERIKAIEVETKHVRDDHDNLVVLTHAVETCRKDINQSFDKLRSMKNGSA